MAAPALARPQRAAAATAPIAVRRCGTIAHRALIACGGVTRPVPGFEATPFRLAGNEIVWVGVDAAMHPRVALADAGLFDCGTACLDIENARVHPAETVGGQGFSSNDARQSLTRAILRLVQSEKPAGFGHLLAAQALPFPLSHRRDAAVALAQACADDDAPAFTTAALRLLGVGSGLTPSGDDFVGAALFARHAVVTTAASGSDAQAVTWSDVRDTILAAAATRTHVISFALLQDLAHGASYAALHGFATALNAAHASAMFNAMREIITIGHSSGWDMLTGFIAAVSGTKHLTGTTHIT